MLEIKSIFKHRYPLPEHLLASGFVFDNGIYTHSYAVWDGQFQMEVTIRPEELPQVRLIDNLSDEEYFLIHTHAQGEFVGALRAACEEKLREIADECYYYEVFHQPQTKAVLDQAKAAYGHEPEFLWARSPDCAILRRTDTQKWYAALITVAPAKLGLKGEKPLEIIDLHAQAETVSRLLTQEGFYPGYHMNKKYWYTVVLDGTVPDAELFRLLDESYRLAKK